MKRRNKVLLLGLIVLAAVAVPVGYSYQTYAGSYGNNIRKIRSSLETPLFKADFDEFMANLDVLSQLMTVEVKYVGWAYFSDFIDDKPTGTYDLFFDKGAKKIWARDSFKGKTSLGLMRVYVYQHDDPSNFIAYLRVQLEQTVQTF